MLFKRGAKATVPTKVEDEEAGGFSNDLDTVQEQDISDPANTDKPPPMADTFSWKGLTYTVPTAGGEHRRLLNNVAGYVAPGKLTALMGESGAGKVHSVA